MEIKEAISHYNYGISHDIFSEPVTSYARLAVDAVERQIAKKPTAHKVDVEAIKIGNANWKRGTTVYKCPCCNQFISIIYDYCYKCGQKIDWN